MSDTNYNTPTPTRSNGNGRIGAGLFVLLVGGLLLIDQMGVPLPDWIFSWPTLLVALGIFVGLRHRFHGGGWFFLMAIGGYFLLQQHFPEVPLKRYFWPIFVIFIGFMIILAPRRTRWKKRWHEDWAEKEQQWRAEWKDKEQQWKQKYSQTFASSREGYSSEDFIETMAIFGGVHKRVISKNFRGGDITNVMGGTEIDLSQADIQGLARIDITQVMGGTKIIVPPHWEVRTEVSAVFSGFEDKRQQPAVHNPEKVLIIDGTSFFGGIELKNY